jgi:hypothetical protein
MKKTILIYSILTMLFISCSKKDIIKEQIEKNIIDSAMGNDLNYKPSETKLLIEFKSSDFVNEYSSYIKYKNKDLDSLIKYTSNVVSSSKENDLKDSYKIFSFMLDNLKIIKKQKNLQSTLFKVYEHSYKINPFQNEFSTNVTNYYIFDYNEKLKGKIDDNEFKELSDEFLMNDNFKYIVMYFQAN